MDIREQHSFLALLVESFRLINRSFSVLLVFAGCAVVGYALLTALLLIKVHPLLVSLLQMLFSSFLGVVLIRLFAARAEGDNISLSDTAAGSILPTVYTIIFGLMCGAVGLACAVIAQLLGKTVTAILAIPAVLALIFVMIRLVFTHIIIAAREQNPIAALLHSWQLTSGRFFYTLGILLISGILPTLFLHAVGYGLYVAIPLYFPNSFSLVHPSILWICVGIVILLCWIGLWLSMMAYLVLVFLNLDYQDNRSGGLADQAAINMPQPQMVQAPTSVIMQSDSEAPQTEAAQPQIQQPQEVQIVRASVKTHSSDESIEQHLEQVYQPTSQDTVEYAEEDRMPTILFDDDMARQMEENRRKWEEEKAKSRQRNHHDDDGNTSTIKMSK